MKLKHYLIAGEHNHYRPWVLSKTAMACFCVSVWALRLFLAAGTAEGAPGLDNQDLMNRINVERTNRFIPALLANSKLSAAAQIKSQDMLDRDYFAHVDPDGNYVWPTIEAQGYTPYQALGENLAIDFTSAEQAVAAWMNSPGHRANILNEKFVDQGMSALQGEFENRTSYVITNLFGALLKKVASSQTEPPPPPAAQPDEPQPDPVPPAQPQSAPPPGQPTSQTPQTASPPADSPTQPQPTAEDVPADAPAESTAASPQPDWNRKSDQTGLVSLRILLSVFAGIYTVLLVIDSIIIHRARIKRENISAGSHTLLMFLVAAVTLFTLWL